MSGFAQKTVVFLLILFVAFTLGSIAPLPAKANADDNAWPMFMHDPQHTGRTSYSGCDSPQLKWRFEALNPISSTPAIDKDGTIYLLTTPGTLFAINPNGTKKWQYETGTGDNLASFWVSPLIGPDGDIYFGASDKVFALRKDGSLKWKTTIVGKVNGSPNFTPEVILQSGTERLCIINPINGDASRYFATGDPILPPAVAEDGTFYWPSQDGVLFADRLDVGFLWNFPAGPPIFSPSIGIDGSIYFRTNNKLYALWPNGTLKWSVYFEGTSLPAIGWDGTLYLGSTDKTFHAVNPTTGEVLWKFAEGNSLYSAATVDGNGVIYFGSADGKLYALNANGEKKWSFDAGAVVAAPPAIGKDGTVYFGSADGNLYALEETPASPTPTTSPTPTSFPDVPSGYWAYGEIMGLVGAGAIKGYPDGTFKPEFPVTRAEFAKMALLSLGYALEFPDTPSFPDVAREEWYYGYVEGAAKHGLVKGYPDGTFQPQGNVTIAEILTVIIRAKGWEETAPPGPPPFILLHDRDDSVRAITAEDWYYGVVGAAAQNGLLLFPDYKQITVAGAGSGEYEVRFNTAATRAQTAVFLARMRGL
jgi:outer membrane protein assembly factor BamB